MVRNLAITVGINQYPLLGQNLHHAEQDAKAMQEFLSREAGFEQVYLFSDNASAVGNMTTRPFRNNLLMVLDQITAKVRLQDTDSFWFFFSGHGARQAEQDYLLLSDSYFENLPDSAISVDRVLRCLRQCGAGNLVLILDACRSHVRDSGKGVGSQTRELARQYGVISLFSCSPSELSYEISALQQGAFTYALLEGLRGEYPLNCSTVQQLDEYLIRRVPEVSRQHGQQPQTPYMVAEPARKYHQLLLPSQLPPVNDLRPPQSSVQSPQSNLDKLKAAALHARYVDRDLNQARQLWKQFNAIATASEDRELAGRMIEEIVEEIAQQRNSSSPPIPVSDVQTVDKGSALESSSVIHPNPSIYLPIQADPDPEMGIDYTNLQDLLKAQQWKEADHATYLVMLQVFGREQWEWITAEQLLNFPCSVLRSIDRLWLAYSGGKFGFSVQQQVWCGIGGQPGRFDGKLFYDFGDRVGWRSHNDWLRYDDFIFSLDARDGHFPSFGYGVERWDRWADSFPSFFPRVTTCLWQEASS